MGYTTKINFSTALPEIHFFKNKKTIGVIFLGQNGFSVRTMQNKKEIFNHTRSIFEALSIVLNNLK